MGKTEPVKINRLEIENVKRVKAVALKPAETGLTIIGGKNRQGKTSVLDAIAWALGGDTFRPSQPGREGSAIPPMIHIVLNNGFIVERKGKNSALKVTDPSGEKAGQQLLNEFISQFALDLPKFMGANNKKKADILLQLIGVGDRVTELEAEEKELYSERLTIGRIADQKDKYAKEQPYFTDVPNEPVSASELIRQQQEILAKNGENQKKRGRVEQLRQSVTMMEQNIRLLREQLDEKEKQLSEEQEALETAMTSAKDLQDESTAELEANITHIEEINRKVRANLDKEKAEEDAQAYRDKYDSLTSRINDVRKEKTDLLKSANLPLPELSIQEGELIYKGQKWDNMSGSEQLIVSTAIVRKLNPKCGFVLMDKLEQMDMDTLREFGDWLSSEGLQAITTRVGSGEECSILIEDGYAVQQNEEGQPDQTVKSWKEGVF